MILLKWTTEGAQGGKLQSLLYRQKESNIHSVNHPL